MNVASRIESIAQKDQILITESIYKNIRYKEGIETAFQGEQKFKNLTDPFKVYSVKVNKIPSEYFDQTPTSITAEKTKKNRSLILVSSIVILLLLGYFLGPQILSGITQNTITGKSIAVLSFLDMSPNGDQEYLGDGIAEEILNLLSKAADLKVISRTSSFQFKGEKIDAREVGSKLGVAYLLEGSIRKFQDKIRITAQMIDCADGAHVWSDSWDQAFGDLFEIQDKIAGTIANKLQTSLELRDRSTDGGTNNIEAYEYFLEAEYLHFTKFFSTLDQKNFEKAEGLYRKAIALDYNFSNAHAGLADLYNTYLVKVSSDSSIWKKSHEEINIALRLAPNSPYVNDVKGHIEFWDKNRNDAYYYFKRAIELGGPNDEYGYHGLAEIIGGRLGLNHEAIGLSDIVINIAPLDKIYYAARGRRKYWIGRSSLADFEKAISLDSNYVDVLYWLTTLHCIRKEPVQAKLYLDRLKLIKKTLNPNINFEQQKALYYYSLGENEKALEIDNSTFMQFLISRKDFKLPGKDETFYEAQFNEWEERDVCYYWHLLAYTGEPKGEIDSTFLWLWGPISDHPAFPEVLELHRKRYDENKKRYSIRGSILK